MLGVRALLALPLILLIAAAPIPAAAANGPEFLDTRPILIDLDRVSIGDRWLVEVVAGQGVGQLGMTLYSVFQPQGVIAVSGRSARSATQGTVVAFVIQLRKRVEGSGELVVVSGGSVVRRQISTQSHAGVSPVQVGNMRFEGVRLVPFTRSVRVGKVTIDDAPGEPSVYDNGPSARRVGVLSSDSGDLADVVRQDNDFFVEGADTVGKYEGTLHLLPDQDGGQTIASLRVRDLPVWPLLVLLLGLGIVQTLDRYQRRLRPRRLLELRLGRLRDRARAIQSEIDLAVQVCALPGDPALLLDRLAAEALTAYDQTLTDEERKVWQADGSGYKGVTDAAATFRSLADKIVSLRRDRTTFLDSTEPADRHAIEHALTDSRIGEALRGHAVQTTTDMTDAASDLDHAKTELAEFRAIYRRLALMRRHGSDDVRLTVSTKLARLVSAPDDLTDLAKETEDLYRRWLPPVPPEQVGVTVGQDFGPQLPSPPLPSATPRVRRGFLRRVSPVAIAAVAIVIGISFALTLGSGQIVKSGSSSSPVVSSPNPSSTGTTIIPPVSALPKAPVSLRPQAPAAVGFVQRDPTTGQIVWLGLVLPIMIAGVLAAVGVFTIRRYQMRPPGDRLTELDTASTERELGVENLRFSLASGAIVVLSGMSLLYVGNPTFGSAGDYLTVLLWGTAVSEGLQLARRLWPLPSMAQG